MGKHAYGWRRPLPGLTFPYADTGGLAVATQVDPRQEMPPVFNQGQLGSCTANATAACFQYDGIVEGHDPGELSRRWIYHFEKAIEHTLGQGDTGAVPRESWRGRRARLGYTIIAVGALAMLFAVVNFAQFLANPGPLASGA